MNLAQNNSLSSIFQSFSASQFPFELLMLCLGVSVLGLLAAKLLRLDSFARRLLVRRMPRSELIARLEELATLTQHNDPRGIRRIGDRCDWQLFRIGADMLAKGAEPPEIAQRIEQTGEAIFRRRVSSLRRLAGFASGVLIFPVGVLVTYLLGAFGPWDGLESLLAAGAFATAMTLLVINSTARWMCEHAETTRAAYTLETEALIFALSAIRGGAHASDVREMMSLMLGQEVSRTPLRQAA